MGGKGGFGREGRVREGGKEGGREGGREGWGREGLHVRMALYHHLIGKGVNV